MSHVGACHELGDSFWSWQWQLVEIDEMESKELCENFIDGEYVVINYPEDLNEPDILSNDEPYNNLTDSFKSMRICPLDEEAFNSYFDVDGRLVDEHKFRQAVFRGGVQPHIRKTVWKYLFHMYPFHSTKRERNILLAEYHMKYKLMKESWKKLRNNSNTNVEVSDYSEEQNFELLDATFYNEIKGILEMDDTEAQKQINWMEVHTKIDLQRLDSPDESLATYLRIIDKDVPRTDRDLDMYKGDNNPNLDKLRDILYTFVYFHPEVGYSQGMNDHLGRFLLILQSEAEAYWCFSSFLEKFQDDFTEEGMTRKIDLLGILLKKTDPDLYEYIMASEIGNLTFCHRWLILMFKREFDLEEGLRIFEIISSHHLEMSSIDAKKARDSGRWKEMKKEGKPISVNEDLINAELTFDLFICATILIENRAMLFKANDCMDFITCTKLMVKNITLDDLLQKAEQIFYNYCQLSVIESFEIL